MFRSASVSSSSSYGTGRSSSCDSFELISVPAPQSPGVEIGAEDTNLSNALIAELRRELNAANEKLFEVRQERNQLERALNEALYCADVAQPAMIARLLEERLALKLELRALKNAVGNC